MSELKPCPFCGGEAEEYNNSDFHDCYRVYCMDCGAETQAEEEWNRAKKWNKREGEIQLAKQQEEIERLNIDMQSLVNLGHEANSRLRNDAIKQQEEIAEYKAFMLGLKLSSEDEARMLRMFDKYK